MANKIYRRLIPNIRRRNQSDIVAIDVYALDGSDFIYLTVASLGDSWLLNVAMIRTGVVRLRVPNIEVHYLELSNLNLLQDVRGDFLFWAELIADQDFLANGNILFDDVEGNEGGNYNPGTGDYTFSGAMDGTFEFVGTVMDDPGAGGATTVQLVSSVKGVIDSILVPNNTTVPVSFTHFDSWASGEIVSVELLTGMATVNLGATFNLLI